MFGHLHGLRCIIHITSLATSYTSRLENNTRITIAHGILDLIYLGIATHLQYYEKLSISNDTEWQAWKALFPC